MKPADPGEPDHFEPAWQDATTNADQERQPGVVSAERETGLEPATLGLGSQDSQSRKRPEPIRFSRIAFPVTCRMMSQGVAGGSSRAPCLSLGPYPWGSQGPLHPVMGVRFGKDPPQNREG